MQLVKTLVQEDSFIQRMNTSWMLRVMVTHVGLQLIEQNCRVFPGLLLKWNGKVMLLREESRQDEKRMVTIFYPDWIYNDGCRCNGPLAPSEINDNKVN